VLSLKIRGRARERRWRDLMMETCINDQLDKS
jgi:hypothetical protein